MDQTSSGEVRQGDERAELLTEIESLRTDVLSEIHRQFTFYPDAAEGRGVSDYNIWHDAANDYQPYYVFNHRANTIPISLEAFDPEVYGEGIKGVEARVVIIYGVDVVEPEHWKRVLFRKRYVPAILEPTDEVQTMSLFLDVKQEYLGLDSWFQMFGWHPDEKPKKQRKQLRKILSFLEFIDENKLDAQSQPLTAEK